MDDPIVTQVRRAIVRCLKQLQNPPYASTSAVQDSNLYDHYDKKAISQRRDSNYPMAFVVYDRSVKREEIGGLQSRVASYAIIFVCRATGAKTVEDVVEQAEQDITDLFDRNRNLGGLVEDVDISESTNDSGFSAPDGILTLMLSVEFLRHGPLN